MIGEMCIYRTFVMEEDECGKVGIPRCGKRNLANVSGQNLMIASKAEWLYCAFENVSTHLEVVQLELDICSCPAVSDLSKEEKRLMRKLLR